MSFRLSADGHERYCPACEKSFAAGDQCPQDGTELVLLGSGPDRLLGTTLDGRYTIVEKLGAGGMGTVYRGLQLSVNREVAIKVVSPNLVAHSDVIKRFLREAKLASRLSHPNAVAVLDFGRADGDLFFLVMERLVGQTLEHLIAAERRLPVDRALAIASQICDALVGAHQLSIVHRDLKPSNIMIVTGAGGRELVKVLDFGLAKLVSSDVSAQVTRTGVVMGTPAYMSPELASGRDADARADLYALGCIFYEMLTGVVPFAGKTLHETLAMHAAQPPRPLADVPPWLAAVVLRLLAKQPDERFPSAAATLEALSGEVPVSPISGALSSRSLALDSPVTPPSPASVEEVGPTIPLPGRTPAAAAVTPPAIEELPRRSGRKLVIALALLALAAAALISWQMRAGDPADEQPGEPEAAAPPAAAPPPAPTPESAQPPAVEPPAADAAPAAAEKPKRARRQPKRARERATPDKRRDKDTKDTKDTSKRGLPF